MNRQCKNSNYDLVQIVSPKKLPTDSSSGDIIALPEGFIPDPFDVICSKGKSAFHHPGNRRYRMIIEERLQEYSAAKSKLEKSFIVSAIIESIRGGSPSSTGFVKFNNGRWYEVESNVSREKIGQSFRDLLHTKYRSSSKAKKRRQKSDMITKMRSNTLLREVGENKPFDFKFNVESKPDLSPSAPFNCSQTFTKLNSVIGDTDEQLIKIWDLLKGNDDNHINKNTMSCNNSFEEAWNGVDTEPNPIDELASCYPFPIGSMEHTFPNSMELIPSSKELVDEMDTLFTSHDHSHSLLQGCI